MGNSVTFDTETFQAVVVVVVAVAAVGIIKIVRLFLCRKNSVREGKANEPTHTHTRSQNLWL